MSAEDIAFWGFMWLAGVLLIVRCCQRVSEARAAEEARWDAWVEAALIEGNSHSETPPYDELAVARFRRDMDRLDEVTEEWGR